MPRFRSFLGAWLLAGAFALTAGATGASASTFFVNGTTGADTNACTSSGAACKTIKAAVEKSEVVPGAATIEVAAGVYQEVVELANAADSGITINGAGSATVIEGPVGASEATVAVGGLGVSATLSNLNVVNPSGDEEDGISVAGPVTLDNVAVDMQNAGSGIGIRVSAIGATTLTLNGGSVTMENGETGSAIADSFGALTVTGTNITVADGATGGGITAAEAPTSLTNVSVSLGNKASGAGITTQFGSVSMSNVAVKVANGSTTLGVESIFASSMTANNLTVMMENPASAAPGVVQAFGNATFEHLQVGGAWKGSSLIGQVGEMTIADSRLTNGPESTHPTVVFLGGGEGRGLLIQRSVLQTTATAEEANLLTLGSNVTIDSSELLGGPVGVAFIHEESKVRTATIAGTTIDAGVLGERDPAAVFDVSDMAAGKASIANVNIEGSILFERQKATIGAGEKSAANVTCSYSDAPNQTQAATATEGTIACANGVASNTTTEPLTALFSAPITSYGLLPGSSAIDSVPASAIALPFGIAPSATDLAGNPRVVDGNGDCLAVQDKGALELQGFAKACPSPPPPPTFASITNLSIAPNALYAAPSGATISKAHKKRKYGATIGWRDSLAATTTFTVIRETGGRKQGKSCKKPSKRNRRGKRCTILTAIGSFMHADGAGANKVHFSGRLNGKKLAKGKYVLQAVPHTAAGNGKAVKRQFKIKG